MTGALEADCVRSEDGEGEVELEWRPAPRPAQKGKPPQPGLPLGPHRPDWLENDAPPPPPELPHLTPSTVLDEEAPPARAAGAASAEAALVRGRLIHRLLESLPAIAPGERDAIGAAYLAAFAGDMDDAERAALLTEVTAVMEEPSFAPVFAAGSRAEVEIVGRIVRASGEAAISGRVDRLAVTETQVLIVDYKTNRPAPETLRDGAAGLCHPACALPHDPEAALSRPRGGGCAVVDRPARAHGNTVRGARFGRIGGPGGLNPASGPLRQSGRGPVSGGYLDIKGRPPTLSQTPSRFEVQICLRT